MLNFTTYGQTEWLAVSVEEAGNYTITARCTDTTGDFYVEGIEANNTYRRNFWRGSTETIDLNGLNMGDTIYIKVYPYSSDHASSPEQPYEHNVNITVTKN